VNRARPSASGAAAEQRLDCTFVDTSVKRGRMPLFVQGVLNRIFFLTFVVSNSIYESHCDFFLIASFSIKGDSLNEERNQESRSEKES
jgi:hypothetical protein